MLIVTMCFIYIYFFCVSLIIYYYCWRELLIFEFLLIYGGHNCYISLYKFHVNFGGAF